MMSKKLSFVVGMLAIESHLVQILPIVNMESVGSESKQCRQGRNRRKRSPNQSTNDKGSDCNLTLQKHWSKLSDDSETLSLSSSELLPVNLQENNAPSKICLLINEDEWVEMETAVMSLMDQIVRYESKFEEKKREVETLSAALERANQQLEKKPMMKMEKDKALHINNTWLKKEQVWVKKENMLTSKLRETHKSRDSHVALLEKLKKEVKTLEAALKKAEKNVKSNQNNMQDKSSHLQKTEDLNSTWLKKEKEWVEKEKVLTSKLKEMQKSRDSHAAQLVRHNIDDKAIKAALEEAEKEWMDMETVMNNVMEENVKLKAQLEEMTQVVGAAALKKSKQRLEGEREDLQNQTQKKKKKKKWFKRLFAPLHRQ